MKTSGSFFHALEVIATSSSIRRFLDNLSSFRSTLFHLDSVTTGRRTTFSMMRSVKLAALVHAALIVAALEVMNKPTMVEAGESNFKVLNFFLHGNAYVAVPPLPGSSNPLGFGTVIVFDDPMTVSPDATSLEIGRGRGLSVVDQNTTQAGALEFLWTAEFNEASGYTPGSTLTFKGFDRITDSVREIAIVGGTVDFRLARGWAVIETYALTAAVSNLNITAFFEYGLRC